MGIGEREGWRPGNNSSRIPRDTWEKTTFNCKHFFPSVEITIHKIRTKGPHPIIVYHSINQPGKTLYHKKKNRSKINWGFPDGSDDKSNTRQSQKIF